MYLAKRVVQMRIYDGHLQSPMSIYKVFAQNLREECTRFQSIAHVCRGADINRQQFNKYLSGSTIPNARTLSKLSKYLGIEEAQLFVRPADKSVLQNVARAGDPIDSDNVSLSQFLSSMNKKLGLPEFQTITNEFASGYYFCYFPLEGFPNFLVRSVLQARVVDGQLHFTRHTRIKSPSSRGEHIGFGKHHGFFLDDSTSIVMMARNMFPPYQLSTIYLRKGPMYGVRTKMGLAFTQGFSNMFACRVCIESLGTSNGIARKAIQETGIIPSDHASVPAVIGNYLTQSVELENGMLGLPMLDRIFELSRNRG